MKVSWNFSEKPEVDRYGVSEQSILLTNHNRFATGYWNDKVGRWELDSLVVTSEEVIAWLDGVTDRWTADVDRENSVPKAISTPDFSGDPEMRWKLSYAKYGVNPDLKKRCREELGMEA